MSEKWNSSQLEVINNTDGNMIVSASAGSGKTATMIERVKCLILEKKIPVSRILMLSFNEAIASEIKVKMAKSLISEVKTSDDKDFLRDQIDALGMADITTMHSFCNSLIKEYFDVVGVDPSYTIMDDKESDVIINKSINEVFDDYFESGDVDFILLKDKLSASNDDNLRSAVENIFRFSNSLLNGDEWLDKAISDNYAKPLCKTKPIKILVEDMRNHINDAIDALEEAMNVLDTTKYTEIPEMLDILRPYESEENILKLEPLSHVALLLPRRSLRNDNPDKPYYTKAKDAYKYVISKAESLFKVSYDKMEEDHRQDSIVANKLMEVVRRFKTVYNREKAEVNKLDFNDMEHLAVEILSHEDIKNDIKKKYDYVCVDEYQDTNEVQNRVLDSVSSGNNQFMVGDPKQSIYKFRFTKPEIFIKKLEEYKKTDEGNVVELDLNYRSSPLILEKVNKVFDRLMVDKSAGMIRNVYSGLLNGLDFEDKVETPFEVMLYEKPRDTKDTITESHTYRISEELGSVDVKKNAEIEARYIAEKIEDIRGKEIYDVKLGDYRPIDFSDMAILASSRTETVKLVLDNLEQDYHYPIDSACLKRKDEPQEVKILLDFLRAIDNPLQDIPLYTVMKMFFDFRDSEFVEMKREVGKVSNFYKIIYDDMLGEGALKDKVSDFKAKFDEYRLMSTFMNVHDFLIAAIAKSDFKRKLLMSQNGRASIDNIDKFITTLKDKKHSSTVQEFLYAYDNYNIMNDIESTSQSLKNSIHTSTIHQSKGLEYPVVFIINAGAPIVGRQMSLSQYLLDEEAGFAIRTYDEKNKTVYSNWLMDAITMKKTRSEIEERMRLFYVAMTRAKNCLYIVGSISKNKKSLEDARSFSEWLYNIGEEDGDFQSSIVYRGSDDIDDVIVKAVPDKVRAFCYEEYSEEDKSRYDEVFGYTYPHEDATHIAQKYTVTSINHEEREKEEYVPELYETEKTSVGSIYHKFMEHVNYEADTIDAIKAEMSRMIEEKILTEDEISNIDINDVYKCMNSAIIKKAKVSRHDREKKFMMCLPMSEVKEGASPEKVIIQGIADLVIYGDENILVDFKKSSQREEILKETYRTQLELYKFALEDSMGIKFDRMCLYVIGQDKIIDLM